MAVTLTKQIPIQVIINGIAHGAMEKAAAARGVPLSRFASQLLEAAWSARAKPTGDDPELERAVSAAAPSPGPSVSKVVERVNDAENRLRVALAEVDRMKARLARKDGEVAEAERIRDLARRELDKFANDARDANERARVAEEAVATVRGEVAGVGERILDRERWCVAFQRTRVRLDKMARSRREARDAVRALEIELAQARAASTTPAPPTPAAPSARAQADLLPRSIVKAVRAQLAMRMTVGEIAKMHQINPEVVGALKR